MADKNSHARAPGKTSITVSVTEAFRDEIDAAARDENRTRSNFIVTVLAKKLAERNARRALEAHAPSPFPSTARSSPETPSLNEGTPRPAAVPATPLAKYARIRPAARTKQPKP